MAHFNHFLKSSLPQQNHNIQSYTLGDLKVWLKKASARHSTWIYVPLRWLARILQLKALTPIPNVGGREAIECEVRRIQSLQQKGIATPKLLAVTPEAILTEDAANDGDAVLQFNQALAKYDHDPEQKLALFQSAIEAIQDIHAKKSYLSEAFARNILVNAEHEFTFIDFETDPGQVLDLDSCQVRDWLCFIFSTAYHFSEPELEQACQIFIDRLLPNTKAYLGILNVSGKLRWARRINFEKFGNDGKRIKKCFQFFNRLEQQKALPMI